MAQRLERERNGRSEIKMVQAAEVGRWGDAGGVWAAGSVSSLVFNIPPAAEQIIKGEWEVERPVMKAWRMV